MAPWRRLLALSSCVATYTCAFVPWGYPQACARNPEAVTSAGAVACSPRAIARHRAGRRGGPLFARMGGTNETQAPEYGGSDADAGMPVMVREPPAENADDATVVMSFEEERVKEWDRKTGKIDRGEFLGLATVLAVTPLVDQLFTHRLKYLPGTAVVLHDLKRYPLLNGHVAVVQDLTALGFEGAPDKYSLIRFDTGPGGGVVEPIAPNAEATADQQTTRPLFSEVYCVRNSATRLLTRDERALAASGGLDAELDRQYRSGGAGGAGSGSGRAAEEQKQAETRARDTERAAQAYRKARDEAYDALLEKEDMVGLVALVQSEGAAKAERIVKAFTVANSGDVDAQTREQMIQQGFALIADHRAAAAPLSTATRNEISRPEKYGFLDLY